MAVIQSIPYPEYTTLQRDTLVVNYGYVIFNTNTNRLEKYVRDFNNVSKWIPYIDRLYTKVTVGNIDCDFNTLEDAILYYNTITTPLEILIIDNITVNSVTVIDNINNHLRVKGLGSSISSIQCNAKLELRSSTDIEDITLSGNATSAGNIIELTTNSLQNYEFQNIILKKAEHGILDYIGSNIWLFNFTISEISIAGYTCKYDTALLDETFTNIEVGTFEKCTKGIYLFSAKDGNFLILNCTFLNNAGGDGITIDPTTYDYGSKVAQILNCNWNRVGTFITGFDFTRSDGRDANVEIIGSPNISSSDPRGYFEVIDNTLLTTLPSANVFTRCNFDAYDVVDVYKLSSPSINRIIYLSDNPKDLTMIVSISSETDVGAPNEYEFAVVKNGTYDASQRLTAGTPVGSFKGRFDTNDNPKTGTIIANFNQVKKDDYFDIVVRQDAANAIRVTRLTGKIITV